MIRQLLLPLLLSAVMQGNVCNAQSKWKQNILICEENEPVPGGSKFIGKISASENMLSRDHELLFDRIIEKVHRRNGNILKITKMEMPGVGSNFYKIWGDVYYISDVQKAFEAMPKVPDTITPHLIADTAQYALLFIYRPFTGTAQTPKYVLHLGDKELYTVRNGCFDTIRVYKEGPVTLWATILTRSQHKLDIHFGKAYFIKCEAPGDIALAEPRITIMGTYRGYKEYTQVVYDVTDRNTPAKRKADYMEN